MFHVLGLSAWVAACAAARRVRMRGGAGLEAEYGERESMRKGTTAAVFVLLLSVSGAWGGERIKVATLNCEWLCRAGCHLKYDLPFDPARWDDEQRRRFEALGGRDDVFRQCCATTADLIKRIDADILCLQEVGPREDLEVLHDILSARGMTYAYRETGTGVSNGTYVQYVAIWSRRPLTLARPIYGQAIYQTELDDAEAEAEGIAEVDKGLHAVLEAGGVPVHLYCLHLKSERGGHESDAKRIAQATIVRRDMLQYLNRPVELDGSPARDVHVIVAGDLNDGPGQPTLRRIRGLDDIYPDLVQTWHTTYFNDPRTWPERWSHDYKGSRNRIDHILISTGLLGQLEPQRGNPPGISATVIPVEERLPKAGLVSDHRPVVVTLRFRGS